MTFGVDGGHVFVRTDVRNMWVRTYAPHRAAVGADVAERHGLVRGHHAVAIGVGESRRSSPVVGQLREPIQLRLVPQPVPVEVEMHEGVRVHAQLAVPRQVVADRQEGVHQDGLHVVPLLHGVVSRK
jgi:hypothetical protein